MVRGRFAPTPSGLLHIGNARTALLAWLQIRSQGGEFLLRMEDIDKPRSRPEYARQILADLAWLGLDWDEGPDVGGPWAPYTQSERLGLYEDALEKLADSGYLYPCYCSRAELMAIASAPHGLQEEGPSYPGVCRGLSAEERAEKERRKKPSLRFRMPDKPIRFTDGCVGAQAFPSGAGGDFIVRRADGIIAYQLAVVVDDAAMGITEVLRGMDLLDSTPRQLALYKALGFAAPRYTHVPLLYGPDGERLSKRHASTTIGELRDKGASAERIVGAMAYWSGLHDREEPIKAAELIDAFRLDKVPAEPVQLQEGTILCC